MLKNSKGITLIALVITIIVLLILAGVSIAMLTGNNGILTQANNAKDDTTKAEVVDRVNMAIQAAYAESLEKGTTFGVSAIVDQYNDDNGSGASGDASPITITLNGKNYELTLTPVGNSYTVKTTNVTLKTN